MYREKSKKSPQNFKQYRRKRWQNKNTVAISDLREAEKSFLQIHGG